MARGEFQGAVPAPSVKHGYHFHFGNVEKRINSTKVFDYTVLKDLERCDFKEPTSMENPHVYITLNSINISPQWNYCHCEETASFYWIADITTRRANIWDFSLVLDPLATYKDTIVKTSAFIEYGFNSDASGSSLRIQDARQNVAQHPQISSESFDPFPGTISATGCYILSAVGASGLQAFALSKTELSTLLATMSVTWEALTKAMVRWELALGEFMNKFVFGGSAMDCVRSCIWVPFDKTKFLSGGMAEITLGQFHTGVIAMTVNANSNVVHSISQEIPWPADDWKRLNCQVQVYIPFLGTVGIPVDQCNDAASITINSGFSLIDGGVSVQILAGRYCVYTGSTNISSPYGIGTSNIDPVKSVTSAVGAVGSALSFGTGLVATTAGFSVGGVQKMLNGASGTIANAAQAISPINQSVGTLSGHSQIYLPLQARLTLLYYKPVDDAGFQKMYGYPVMKVGTPANGYCKTRGFSCAPLGAKPDEISYINAAMDSGVFIE